MVTRRTNKKDDGFYRILNGEVNIEPEEVVNNCLMLGEDDVYEVERLVERKVVRVSQ